MLNITPAKVMIALLLKINFAILVMLFAVCVYLVPKAEASSAIAGKTIVIDPGHGADDPGCSDANNSCFEKDITMAVALELAQLLEQDGVNVKLTRNGENKARKFLFFKAKDDLDSRIKFTKDSKAELLLSLHVSSYFNTNKAGAVAYYKEGSKQSQVLAQCMQAELIKIPEMAKRTIHGRNYYLLDQLKIPSAVIELGYLSNSQERDLLNDPVYYKKLANALCAGLLKYNSTSQNNTSIVMASERKTVGDRLVTIQNSFRSVTLKTLSQNLKVISNRRNIEKIAMARMESLFYGPAQTKSFNSELSQNLTLNTFNLSGSMAMIDLGVKREDSLLSSDEEWNDIALISNSLFDIPEIKTIKFTVNGLSRETLAGHIDISEPISRDKLPLTKIVGGVMDGKKSRVAIVIDDFGPLKTGGVDEILSVGCPITVAVMPNMENSENHAQLASKVGYAVIVHLPMQPQSADSSWLGPGAITSGMSPEKIYEQAFQDLSQVPFAAGFNNHMGSLATSKEDIVRPVLEAAREKDFFVLDSRTTGKTKLGSMAKEMGIPFAERDVFLDNKRNLLHIKKQLDLLADKALKNGSAIGIGHVGKNMAQAIKEMKPIMEAKGVEFVYIAELVH